MKCQECVSAGQSSCVHSQGCTQTLLGWLGPYYDENGTRHSHDPNVTTCGWVCDNGHQFTTKHLTRCRADGCDYGGPQ